MVSDLWSKLIETVEDYNKDIIGELTVLIQDVRPGSGHCRSRRKCEMDLEQKSDVAGHWCYPGRETSDNDRRPVDLFGQTGLIIASAYKRDHRRHYLTRQSSISVISEE
ncbi:hypothetical protein RB195_009600 [Necator americanus]|uniref:Uncharacterized protein n=1 Tax=Necator americanus TaxID=51031 RepID=A0ABR1CWI0_NECAM